jgi:hypothetical protein
MATIYLIAVTHSSLFDYLIALLNTFNCYDIQVNHRL